MSSLINKQIRFPSHHYVGIIGRTADKVPLGFMTEDGADEAAKKRKDTVDRWVASNSYNKTIMPATVFENTPQTGFRLDREIKRNSGWGSGNVKWRIEDPRGFGLEISSPNMAQIIDTCVIDKGEILSDCVWARLKGDNVLVPVDSELYLAAQENSARLTKNVPLREVSIGDHITLLNGTKGRYLGKMFHLHHPYDGDCLLLEWEWEDKASFVLLMEVENKPEGHIITSKSLKVAVVDKKEEITAEAAELIVNNLQNSIYSIKKVALGGIVRSPFTYTENVSRQLLTIHDDKPVIFHGYMYAYHHRDGVMFFTLDPVAYAAGEIKPVKSPSNFNHYYRRRRGNQDNFMHYNAKIDPTTIELECFDHRFTTTGGFEAVAPI